MMSTVISAISALLPKKKNRENLKGLTEHAVASRAFIMYVKYKLRCIKRL